MLILNKSGRLVVTVIEVGEVGEGGGGEGGGGGGHIISARSSIDEATRHSYNLSILASVCRYHRQ